MCTEIFDKHTPKKKRCIPSNYKSFIIKEIFKAILTRSRLKNSFIKTRTEENRRLFYKQRNKCVSPHRQFKTNYIENLNEKKHYR